MLYLINAKSRLCDMVSMWPASLASGDRDFGWCDVSAISVAWYPCAKQQDKAEIKQWHERIRIEPPSAHLVFHGYAP